MSIGGILWNLNLTFKIKLLFDSSCLNSSLLHGQMNINICLHRWSHEKPILYLIFHCFNKIDISWNPIWQAKICLFIASKKVIYFRLYLGYLTLQDVN